jgi:hypothetical protein
MTKKEIVNRNIGLTFDFLRQVIDEPSLLDNVPNGSVLEFVEKDFSKETIIGSSKRRRNKKYLQVRSHFRVIDNKELFQIDIEKILKDRVKAKEKSEKKLSEVINQAIRDRKKIRFYYESSGGRYWRKVEPYLLAIKQNGNLYFTGYEYPSKERIKEKGNDKQGHYLLSKIDLNELEVLNENFGNIKVPEERIFGELSTAKVICRVSREIGERKTIKKYVSNENSNLTNPVSEPLQPYQTTRSSGIQSFKTGKGFIIIQFSDGTKYLYNYDKPGRRHVEKMKAIAKEGKGLSTYINKYVRNNYALKL